MYKKILKQFRWKNLYQWRTTLAGTAVLMVAVYLTLRILNVAPDLPGGTATAIAGIIIALVGPALRAIFGGQDTPENDHHDEIR